MDIDSNKVHRHYRPDTLDSHTAPDCLQARKPDKHPADTAAPVHNLAHNSFGQVEDRPEVALQVLVELFVLTVVDMMMLAALVVQPVLLVRKDIVAPVAPLDQVDRRMERQEDMH